MGRLEARAAASPSYESGAVKYYLSSRHTCLTGHADSRSRSTSQHPRGPHLLLGNIPGDHKKSHGMAGSQTEATMPAVITIIVGSFLQSTQLAESVPWSARLLTSRVS